VQRAAVHTGLTGHAWKNLQMSNGDVVMDGDVDLWEALGTDAPTSASTMAPRPPPTDEDEDMYVLLVADRAGATFTLGLLDDLVRRIVHHQYARSEHTLRVEFAWIIHSTSELFPFPSCICYSTVSHFKACSGSRPCFWTLQKWQRAHLLTFISPYL
jgi:hypothetical protein